MGELARIRNARDLRVSRGHIAAALVAVVLVAVTAFTLGASLAEETPPPAKRVFTSDVPGEELLELLARIDASSLPGDGEQALTYQDDLKGPAGSNVAAPVQPVKDATAEVHVAAGEAVVPAVADPVPDGNITIWIAESADPASATTMRQQLRDAGQPAWIAATLVEGEPRYTVALGGYATREEAEAAAEAARSVTGLPAEIRDL
jgi:hypothetical protein